MVRGGFRVVSIKPLLNLIEPKVGKRRKENSFQETDELGLHVLGVLEMVITRKSKPTSRTATRSGKEVAPVAEVRAVRGIVLVVISLMFRIFGRKVTIISVHSGMLGMPIVDLSEDEGVRGVANVTIA